MKYDNLYAPLIERIFEEERGKKDPTKAAKTRLHQLYGAYVNGNSHKRAEKFLSNVNEILELHDSSEKNTSVNKNENEIFMLHESCEINIFANENEISDLHDSKSENYSKIAREILNLHASTKERLPFYEHFFDFTSSHATEIKKICDLGCGLNPFAIPLMPAKLTKNLVSYRAYDIDLRTKGLLNKFFALLGLPQHADCADLAVETPTENADLTFMLKLVPVLEAQSPGRGFALANALNTRFLVISYPLKSLGGREKGMEKNYSAAFENALENKFLNNFTLIEKKIVGCELIFILKNARYV